MAHYILRLDDASDYMDIEKWTRMEQLLDKYGIKPIFGIIPKNADESLISRYERNPFFWDLMHSWIDKGWTPAMHGYEHRYITKDGGINPVNKRSEFAGLPYEEQAKKIRAGYQILIAHDIQPDIFFAPSHTFDKNTLIAIRNETPIRIINDTIANDVYQIDDFWFIPQQSGSVRKLPFKTVTFCYHPNTMTENSFEVLEAFIQKQKESIVAFTRKLLVSRNYSVTDNILKTIYMMGRD